MSTLEERRAERRRKRQQEEEGLRNGTITQDDVHADVQERLARRRKEREERMANMSSSIVTVNGEDDLEHKRRERREARLRESSAEVTTDDYSSRRNRRQGTDEDITAPEDTTSSYRSRRRRNWDDEDTPTVNETPSVPDTSAEDAAAERRRRQREEEEEEARRQQEKEAEEERRRQVAAEQRRREEEEDRRREEERIKREEESAKTLESLEQECDESDDSGEGSDETTEADTKLFIDEDDILGQKNEKIDQIEKVRRWNNGSETTSRQNDSDESSFRQKEYDTNNKSVTERNSQNLDNSMRNTDRIKSVFESDKSDKSDKNDKSKRLERSPSNKEVNNNKIREKLDKFEQGKQDVNSCKSKNTSAIGNVRGVGPEGLKGRLQKFEQEIKDQVATKEIDVTTPAPKKELPAGYTPPAQKLSVKLQQFEIAAQSQSAKKPSSRNVQRELEKFGSKRDQRQALLGRWSQSESQLNTQNTRETTPKRNVLNRWKTEDKTNQDSKVSLRSTPERKENLTKRLSGNTGYVATKFLEKASKSIDENASPKSPTNSSNSAGISISEQRKHSQTDSRSSSVSSESAKGQGQISRSKVSDRWPVKENETTYSVTKVVHVNNGVHSRGSSFDNSYAHSRGSSYDGSSEKSFSTQEQEEEERLEAERQEQERERQAEEERMAAEDQKKRKGKKKGLGGLTPEKKKKLKQIIMQKASEDLKKEALAKAEEKEKYINARVEPITTDGLGEAELRKLCSKLHQKLAQYHSEVYDWEFKVGKQEQEVTELTMKVNDSKGKFVKPVLRKVNKTEQKFAKLAQNKPEHKEDFRETLKSVHDEEEQEAE